MRKVKEWLSPSSWANYFHGDDKASTSQPSRDQVPAESHAIPLRPNTNFFNHRLQKSEAFASENVNVSVENTPGTSMVLDPAGIISSPASVGRSMNPAVFSAGPSKRPFTSITPGNTTSSTDDSDSSWVAEANDKDAVDLVELTETTNSDESWIAEDEGKPGHSNNGYVNRPVSRPVSISLAKKELSILANNDTPMTPYTFVMGEGKSGVAQQSTFLVTPGAEVTVQCIANPVFASRPPEVAFPEGASATVVQTSAGRPVMASTAVKFGHKLYVASTGAGTPGLNHASVLPLSPVRKEVVSPQLA